MRSNWPPQCQHCTVQSYVCVCSNVIWWPRVNIAIFSYGLCVRACVWLKMCEMNYDRMLNEACKWMTYCIILDILGCVFCLFMCGILFHSCHGALVTIMMRPLRTKTIWPLHDGELQLIYKLVYLSIVFGIVFQRDRVTTHSIVSGWMSEIESTISREESNK